MERDSKGRFTIGNQEGKKFQPGHDPRRHDLTHEERSRGYWNAVHSISQRNYPLLEGEGELLAQRFLRHRIRKGWKDEQ